MIHVRILLICIILANLAVCLPAQQPSVVGVHRRGGAALCSTKARFVVDFDQDVTGVDRSDFVATREGAQVLTTNGRSVEFIADSHHILCNPVVGFTGTSAGFTLECWVRTTDSSGVMMSYLDPSGVEVRLNNPSDVSFRLNDVPIMSGVAIDDGNWHHVAGVWDSGSVSLYVDGVLSASGVLNATLMGGGELVIASRRNGNGIAGPLICALDEVRMWNVPRAATEINADMNRPLIGTEPGLALYWDMWIIEDLFPAPFPNGMRGLTSNGNVGERVNGARILFETPLTDASRYEVLLDTRFATPGNLGLDVIDDRTIASDNGPLDGPFAGIDSYSFTPAIWIDRTVPELVSPGGGHVTVRGSGFGGATAVLLDGSPIPYTIESNRELVVTLPPCSGSTDVGTLEVVACRSDSIALTYEAPVIYGKNRRFIDPAGGEVVTVRGEGFMKDGVSITLVEVEGVAVPFTLIDDSTLTLTTPASAPTGFLSLALTNACTTVTENRYFAPSTTVNVPGDHPTIAAAVAASTGNQIIRLAPGFYTPGPISLPSSYSFKFVGAGANATILDFQAGAGINASTPRLLEVEGMTLKNGLKPGNNSDGAAIRSTAAVIASDCRFEMNQVGDDGGALYADLLYCSNSVFINNSTTGSGGHGGAIHALSAGRVEGCTFTNNTSNGDGGAAYCLNGEVVGCDFFGNSSGSFGGALYLQGGRVEDCLFTGNSVDERGGGAYVTVGTVRRCTFTQNSSQFSAGGLFIDRGLCSSSLFQGNSATSGTGGVALLWSRVEYSTFEGNIGGAVWGWFYSNYSVQDEVDGCILRNNGAFELGNAPLIAVFDSNVAGGSPGFGNIDVDPHFRDASTGDLRLSCDSPCLQRLATVAYDTDLLGRPRLVFGLADMGAYERQVDYAGTDEDLEMIASVNGACGAGHVHDVSAGDAVGLLLVSRGGTFVGGTPLVFGQPFTTGAPPTPAFPGLLIDPLATPSPFFVLDGTVPGPFGIKPFLPASGLGWSFSMPPGLSGSSLLFQGILVDVVAANGIFVGSNGLELRVP